MGSCENPFWTSPSPQPQVPGTRYSILRSLPPISLDPETQNPRYSRELWGRKPEDPWKFYCGICECGTFGAAVYGNHVLHIVCTLQLASSSCMY
jgi:hypothetical protein